MPETGIIAGISALGMCDYSLIYVDDIKDWGRAEYILDTSSERMPDFEVTSIMLFNIKVAEIPL